MAGFSDIIQGLGGKDAIKSYMDVYKNTMSGLKSPDDFLVSENINPSLKGSVSQNQLLEDQELANDLSMLTKTNLVNNKSNTGHGLSADNAVKTFENVIGNHINELNSKQKEAENAVNIFATGGNIDLHSVMVAMEKSSLSMQLTMQMRNKILQAYQEISKMHV
jgi:flagellar hook-basal body complex protein FliE